MENIKTPRRDLLNELGLEESIVFENPDYDSAIIGYDTNDNRVVYDYGSMVEHLMNVDGMTYEEAIEFIEYNTLRAIPYAGSNPPIVLQRIDDYMDYHNYEKEEDNYEYDFNVENVTKDCINWIRDWFAKNGPGCKGVFGCSGGKDSLIVGALLKEALGPENVIGVAMPDTNQGDNDAKEICEYLGIHYMNMPIDGMTEAFNRMWFYVDDEDFKWSKQSVQNIPPRVRMTMLYALAQTFNGRVVGTTNLDERLTGYFTKYGDGLACDLEPIEMLTVDEILKMGKYLGLPSKWLNRVPSADLPNTKTDEEELGFSYKDFDNYIRGINDVPENVIEKIKNRINKNSFKLNGIAHFEPNLKIRN